MMTEKIEKILYALDAKNLRYHVLHYCDSTGVSFDDHYVDILWEGIKIRFVSDRGIADVELDFPEEDPRKEEILQALTTDQKLKIPFSTRDRQFADWVGDFASLLKQLETPSPT